MVRCGIIVVIVNMLLLAHVIVAQESNKLSGLQIEEILADPPSGEKGDANGDGVRDTYMDEFIELINKGNDSIDLSGYLLSDDDVALKNMFPFPAGTVLAPGERFVLFGGGNPQGIPGLVYTDDGKIGNGLTNSKDVILIIDPATEDTLLSVGYDTKVKDQSLVQKDGTWIGHSTQNGKGLFSPGKPRSLFDKLESLPEYLDLIEGESVSLIPATYNYETGETWRIEDEVLWISWDTTIVRIEQGDKVVAVHPGETEVGFFWHGRESLHTYIRVLEKEKPALVISEVHPNPAWDEAGDTNGDGVRHTYQDEFVEVANQGEQPIDIGGHFLGDDDVPVEKLFRFPDNTVLDTQAVVVLFGGGDTTISERVFVDDGRIGDGLSNWSDTVQLLAPDSSTVVFSMTYEHSTRGVSFARNEDGNYLLHNEIYKEDSTSVGRLRPGDDPVEPEVLTEPVTIPNGLVFSEILMLPEQVDANNDGIIDRHADAFVELTNIGADTLDLSGWRIGDDDIIVSQFFSFPDHVVLLPGGYVTIFGGGTPADIPGTVLSVGDRIGDGLASGGDVVHLIMSDGKTVARSVRVPKATPDVSWLFSRDEPPELHPKISGGRAMSPGTSSDGQEGPSINTAALAIFQPPEDLVISEVYPNPAAGDVGDTNGDGGRHTYQDEFVEIANLGEYPVDIGGYYLGDDDVPVEKLFRFPDSTVLDTQAVVVLFGGGDMPVSERIFADDGRIGDGLSNGGDTVQLLAPDGSTVVSKMTYENARQGISFARDDNGNYLLHNEIYEGKSISIGRLGYGDDTIDPKGLTVPNGLVFSEILMLPEQVDANNDGVVDRHADVFVELTNIGVDTLDLSGWLIGDDDIIVSRFFLFPDDVVLVPDGYVTIFGGGTPVGIPGTVLSAEGRIGNGLSSGGDVVHLIMPDGKTVARSVRVPKATPDVSWLFSRDNPPLLHPQISNGRTMSPGTSPISETKSDTLIGAGKPVVFDVENQEEKEDYKEGIYPSPNPFNSTTVLGFYTTGGPVYVTVYNILGQPIRRLIQQHLPAGYYRRIWDGKNDFGVSVGSGIYIVLLKDKEATFTQRVALLK